MLYRRIFLVNATCFVCSTTCSCSQSIFQINSQNYTILLQSNQIQLLTQTAIKVICYKNGIRVFSARFQFVLIHNICSIQITSPFGNNFIDTGAVLTQFCEPFHRFKELKLFEVILSHTYSDQIPQNCSANQFWVLSSLSFQHIIYSFKSYIIIYFPISMLLFSYGWLGYTCAKYISFNITTQNLPIRFNYMEIARSWSK
ncbi:Hypothetical_protein [Hexamita inflata]|uniref:Hypothetical_protein n=1 Tax=Hexamita inflata TaxID=28002 RepID=A0AA86PNC0_9EUKA|nr:Hypothetical protein HINF_LOCUS29052 [Hexamita inflata]